MLGCVYKLELECDDFGCLAEEISKQTIEESVA